MDREQQKNQQIPAKKDGQEAPEPHYTQVDNAHAAGIGAMGRNDEKLPSGEEEEEAAQDGPAY